MSNVNKGARVKGFGKGQKGLNMANKGSTTKLVKGQLNTMEDKFVQFKALITSMVTQVKYNAYGS
jgi:hypothetical protein